jgi:crossover junction endodeoxyribonuclease RusA
MSRSVSFVVEGLPAPQGSKICRCRGTKPNMWNDNEKTLRPWRAKVAEAAEQHRVSWIRQSPLCVRLVFQLPAPKHATNGDWAPTRPDIDKLARAVLDALTGSVLIDDAQVVDLRIRKRYGQPGVAITVTDVHNTQQKEAAA